MMNLITQRSVVQIHPPQPSFKLVGNIPESLGLIGVLSRATCKQVN